MGADGRRRRHRRSRNQDRRHLLRAGTGLADRVQRHQPPIEVGNFGHAPVISPDRMQLAAISVDSVYVSRLDFTGLHEVSIETAGAGVLHVGDTILPGQYVWVA